MSLTVGVVSFNRLFYLRALLESWRTCCGESDQVIVVDNGSSERGIQEYLAVCPATQVVHNPGGGLASAINRITSMARGDYLLILPDDHQVVRYDRFWIDASEALLNAHPGVGSVAVDAQRRVTLERYFVGWRRMFTRFFWERSSGEPFVSYGPFKAGINGIGLLSITRTGLWKELGPLRERPATTRRFDASRGAEDDMLMRYRRRHPLQRRVLLYVPALMEITADPGGYAPKIRDGKRYGTYFEPPSGVKYFDYWYPRLPPMMNRRPVAYEEMLQIASPLGWSPPVSAQGNLVKGNPVYGTTPHTAL